MSSINIDAVLIDDDSLIHAVWKFSADRHSKNLIFFKSAEEFFQASTDFSLDTPIYVDSNLGTAMKGEVISKKIVNLGFNNVYLETGEDAGQFSDAYWLKGVLSKSPPWEVE